MITTHNQNDLGKISRARQARQSLEGLRRRFHVGNSQPRGAALTPQGFQEPSASEHPRIGTILVVEAGGWKCPALLPLLHSADYDVRMVEDLATAIEAVQRKPPRLLIVGGATDLNLYRVLRRASSAPILALVPETDREQVLDAFAAGVDDYQAGAISATEITARVRTMLRYIK